MYPEKEGPTLEVKEKLTDNFLKTVSAFANYRMGRIVFGVADDGTVLGALNPEELRISVENKINDSIFPVPDYHMESVVTEGKTLIVLTVNHGQSTPYTYRNNAYRRTDTSTVKVSGEEFRRLSIQGSGLSFDQLFSDEENLTFQVLERTLKQAIGITQFNRDTLRTLGLIRDNRYTKSAELLADINQNAQSRTSVVRFGRTMSEFMNRADYEYQSLLLQYEGALAMFDKWYQPYVGTVKSSSQLWTPFTMSRCLFIQ